MGQIFDWIYGKLAGFFSEFFEMMNMMGAELFDLPWTQAVVLFFSRFAWVLYAVGLVVAGFEYAIQSQSGRGDLHGLALNGIKGFMAVSLFTTVPVELYRLCVPFPVSWTVKMKKKQKETQDILSDHTQAAGCSDKARAKASGGRQPIEECGRTGL